MHHNLAGAVFQRSKVPLTVYSAASVLSAGDGGAL